MALVVVALPGRRWQSNRRPPGIHMVAEMEAVIGFLPALELLDLQAAIVYQTGWFSFGES